MSKYKWTRTMQRGGDDGYCWVVDVKDPVTGQWREKINGLTKREVSYYRDKFEKEQQAKSAAKSDQTLSAKERYDILHDGMVYESGPDGIS